MSNDWGDHEYYCVKCGHKLEYKIPRKGGKYRPSGHLKKIWCPYCKQEVNHILIQPWSKYTYEDFLWEKEQNNFDEDCNRRMEYKRLKEKVFSKREKTTNE